MAKHITSKSTKSDILEAYEELQKEKESLEQALQKAHQSSPQTAQGSSRNTPATQAQPSEPATSSPTQLPALSMSPKLQPQMDQILDLLNQLQLSFGSAISTLSEKLIAEATTLSDLQDQCQLECEQLQELHTITVDDQTLVTLFETYEARSKEFDQALRQRQEELDLAQQNDHKAWAKEQDDHKRALQDRNATYQKQYERELDEYQYAIDLQRRLAAEEFEQQQQALYQALEDREATQHKQWAEREKELTEQEHQFNDLKAKVEVMDQERDTALKKAKEEGKGIATYQAKIKSDLKAKEIEGQKQIYDLRLASLQETIQTQDTQIQNLSRQLDAALKQVQDLAVKAIEGTSNLNQSQVLREIALEQAKQVKSK